MKFVFVSFDLLVFLAWLFVSTFLPGAILSFSIFHKTEFNFLEKALIGFAIGFVLVPLVPFLLYIALGVKYTYTIALLSVAVVYILALAFFVKNKIYENLKIPDLTILKPEKGNVLKFQSEHILAFCLLLVLVATYLVRIGSYSPIFMELDPYYYTYAATQLLTLGENPLNDATSWYPEVQVNHRGIPGIAYFEAIWYSLYTGGEGAYNNMLLANIASMYPPIAAVLAVFFIYLLVSTVSKREWGLVAAALATFVPIFVYKLAAGEQETQPYAFFALFFFYAFYALSLKFKDFKFPILAGLAWMALGLGSSSQVVALISVLLFTAGNSLLLFLRDENADEIKHLITVNSIIFVIGVVFGSAIMKAIFETGSPYFGSTITFIIPIAFSVVLFLIKQKVSKEQQVIALGAILILGLIVYVSPFGEHIKSVGRGAFQIVQYNSPLDRTIAEQGSAPTVFAGQMGFIAQDYSFPQKFDSIMSFFNAILFILLLPFSLLSNIILNLFVSFVNFVLSTAIPYNNKDVSFLLFWFFAFLLSLIYSAWRFIQKKDDAIFLLFLAMILPPFVVGLLKAKYTIYAGVLFAVAIGFTFAKAAKFIEDYKDVFVEFKNLNTLQLLFALSAVVILLQFVYLGVGPSLIWGSFQVLYQNDPTALASKFTQICAATNDGDVCAAAADPIGYASKGTNYQYNQKLCMLSVFSNPAYLQNANTAPSWEPQAAYSRCTRLSTYWVDSMEWIKENTEPNSRITSWWDYGHWINFFGQRNSAVRNDHASSKMIGDVAHGYLDASPEELKQWMLDHDSKYALFDIELVAGGNSLGGKYGALNYLSCARDNDTSVLKSPGESSCEADHLWETIFVSKTPCTLSALTGKTGFTAYKMSVGGTNIPFYPGNCANPASQAIADQCMAVYQAIPTYCVGEAILITGETVPATYYLNETYPNGDLKLNKAQLALPGSIDSTIHMGPVTQVTLFYTEDKVWFENGVVKSGYEDRKGKFYDSNLYRGMFIGDIPGFTLVYTSPEGSVRIFKITGS